MRESTEVMIAANGSAEADMGHLAQKQAGIEILQDPRLHSFVLVSILRSEDRRPIVRSTVSYSSGAAYRLSEAMLDTLDEMKDIAMEFEE